MAKRDVELVIRAKNEASKAVKSIADALDALTSNQEKFVKSAERTDSTLDALGKALGDLNKQFRGMTATAKVASELDNASAAMQRLEAETSKAEAEFEQLAATTKAATAETARLKAETEQAAAAMKTAKAATAQAAENQKQLNAAIREASSERDRLIKNEERFNQKLEDQKTRVSAATERYQKLAQQLANTVNPTETLKKSVESANKSLQAQETKLASLVSKQQANAQSLSQVGASLTDLQGKLEVSNSAYAAQKSSLDALTASHTGLKTALKSASVNERELATNTEAAASTLERQRGALEKSRAGLAELATTADKAEKALSDIATTGSAALQKALDAQKAKTKETGLAWKEAQAEAKRLAAEMDATARPTKEMAAYLEKVRAQAERLQAEFIAHRAALNVMGAAFREAGTDINTLGAAQQRFAAAQGQLDNDLAKVRAQADATAAAQRGLNNAAGSGAGGQRNLGSSARGAAGGLREGADASSRMARELTNLYGASRQAMSWTQRLRGEVLSLIAAYGGIQGVISLIRNVVDAYQTLEASQNRLLVALNGDQPKTAAELDWIRRNAERLGIEFGTLANEYSKFAIATQGTNLAGANTRKIFLSVAEAAKVAKISNEDMQGVFVALTQIVSKGAVQMEELRQQLGDRLPGAIQIMADGLGVGVDTLIKMMEQGQVTSEALIGFADKLTAKYGAQLPEALKSVNTAIGQLRNAAFQALVTIANSGFIEKFSDFVRTLTSWIQSAEGVQFFQNIGQALGALMSVLKEAVGHWRILAAVLAGIVGIKIGRVLQGFAVDLVRLQRGAQVSALYTAALSKNITVATAATTGMTAAVGRLTTGLRAMMASSGIGLLVTAISIGISAWGTSADQASEAMAKHREIVDSVKNGYDKAGGKIEEWAKKIEGATVTQSMAQLGALRALEAQQKKSMGGAFGRQDFFGLGISTGTMLGEGKRQADLLWDLAGRYKDGKVAVEDFIKAVDQIGQTAANDTIKTIAKSLLDTANQTKDTQQKIAEMEAVLRVLNGTATDADAVLLGLKKAGEGTAEGFKTGKFSIEDYTKALEKLKGFIPGLAIELKKMKDLAEVDAQGMIAFAEAVKSGDIGKIQAAIDTHSQARAAVLTTADESLLKEIAANSKINIEVLKAIGKDVTSREGFRSDAYLDSGGTPTIGFGSTSVRGRAVQMGDSISREDALRQLVADVEKFAAMVDAKVTVPITQSMRQALVSYAYNVGTVSKDIIEKINKGDFPGAQEAIRNGVATVNGQPNAGLKARRASEAELFGKDGFNTYEVAKAEEERNRKRIEDEEKFREELVATNEQRQFETDNLKLSGLQQEINKNIREAELKAQKLGIELSDEERKKIEATTTALYNQQNITKAAEEAEQRVNQLMEVRRSLVEQITYYQQNGESDKAVELQARLQEVNTQLQSAIQNAVGMWQAIGGPQADAAIAKLQTTALTITQAKQGFLDWNRVGQMFAQGLAGAFDRFAQGIAEGKKATEAAREAFLQFASDFLRQIAQMIIQQAILNALKSFFPGMGFGGVGVAHSGGVIGQTRNRTRNVDPAWFAGAMRYHSGGVAGLKPDEVPTILKKGEEVLTEEDPRHRFNGGAAGGDTGGQQPAGGTKILNLFDSASFLSEALNSSVGEKAILNFVKANSGAFKNAIG